MFKKKIIGKYHQSDKWFESRSCPSLSKLFAKVISRQEKCPLVENELRFAKMLKDTDKEALLNVAYNETDNISS